MTAEFRSSTLRMQLLVRGALVFSGVGLLLCVLFIVVAAAQQVRSVVPILARSFCNLFFSSRSRLCMRRKHAHMQLGDPRVAQTTVCLALICDAVCTIIAVRFLTRDLDRGSGSGSGSGGGIETSPTTLARANHYRNVSVGNATGSPVIVAAAISPNRRGNSAWSL